MPIDDLPLDASADPVAAALVGFLTVQGPLTEEQLATALAASGLAEGDEAAYLVDELLSSDDFPHVLPLDDDRFVYLPALLAGRVFTHRLTTVEAAHDLVAVRPDLVPLEMLGDDDPYEQIVDGRELVQAIAGFHDDLIEARGVDADEFAGDAWLLPTGLLAELGAGAGDLVSFSATPQGWQVQRVDAAELAQAPDDLAPRFAAQLPDDESPAEFATLVWTLCDEDPQLFTAPLPPLGDLLDSLGLQCDGDWVAPAGFDFDGWRVDNQVQRVSTMYRLDEGQALGVLGASDILRAGTAGLDPADVTEALAGLVDPDVAEAVLVECLGIDRDGAAELAAAAQTLEGLARRPARPALRWIRARALERMGDVAAAERALDEAETLDPAWPPTLFDLARYASDRGDAERGMALLERAGATDDDPLAGLLKHFRPTGEQPGRNDPCWCGSGRKVKQCHRGPAPLPLAQRAAWLYQKALWFLQDGPWRADLFDLAEVRSADWDEEHAVLRAMADPFVGDAMLFEGGAFAEFVAQRGFLLPDDEQLLAQQWLLAERSLFDVENVDPDTSLTVRDVRTGDRHEVRERAASRILMPGDLICARIVPAGDTMQIFGGLEPVALHQRDALLEVLDSEPDPFEVVAFLSARFAPPVLQNTEGEPLVLCEARLRTGDATALAAALDGAYDRPDADEPAWIEHITTHGMPRIRASLRLDGDTLVVEANSEARMDRALDTVRALDAGLVLVDETRTPVDEVPRPTAGPGSPLAAGPGSPLAAGPGSPLGAGGGSMLAPSGPFGGAGASGASGGVDMNDPQVRAMLDEFVQRYEQVWLDEAVPALDGLTPREAAADPTRRPDLIRLIDTFAPDEGQPGLMSPARLRAALGLA